MNLMPDRHTETLHIEGMTCGGCVASVEKALASVSSAIVQTVEIGRAVVDAGPEATRARLVESVEAAGFDVIGGESEPLGR